MVLSVVFIFQLKLQSVLKLFILIFFSQKNILLIYGSFFVHIIQRISTEIILNQWLTTTLPAVASEAILVFDAMLKNNPDLLIFFQEISLTFSSVPKVYFSILL